MRTLVAGLCVLSLVLLLSAWFMSPDGRFHLVMCDVGQGDGFLLWQGSTQVVIDGGPSADAMLGCVQRHMPFWDTTIELMVASHADADHIGGLSKILETYQVSTVLYSQSRKETTVFEHFNEVVQTKRSGGTRVLRPEMGQSFALGPGFSASVLHPPYQNLNISMSGSSMSPPRDSLYNPPTSEHFLQASLPPTKPTKSNVPTDENDASIILFVRYFDHSFLFTGDAGTDIELALLGNPLISEVDVLKTSHHGSKSGTSREFLQATRPEWALVSVGKKNTYGHPNQEVIARLKEIGSQILRTDELGEVEMISNGSHLSTAD